tara:strand:- start:627 stop:752 length:126 start_codon:yes stop_codon:yes gene_type:complete
MEPDITKSIVREYRREKRRASHVKKRKGRIDNRTGKPGKKK